MSRIVFIFDIEKEPMASVPISRAFVQRLVKRTQRETYHEYGNYSKHGYIQMSYVEEHRRSFFQSVGYLPRISATCTCYDQALRIDIKKDVSNRFQE